jgi:hypothetical protein
MKFIWQQTLYYHIWLYYCFRHLELYLIRWRTMFGIAVVPSILLAVGMAFSPESPRWLFQVYFCKLFDHICTLASRLWYNTQDLLF